MGRAEGEGAAATIHVAVACSPFIGEAIEVVVAVAAGATAGDAIRASGFVERFPGLAAIPPAIGIWGRRCAADAHLAEGDRVELYRPLAVDPKEARRRRAKEAAGRR